VIKGCFTAPPAGLSRNPLGNARVLSRRDAPSRITAGGEHKFTGLLGGGSHVIVDRLAGLFCQLEPDGLPGLFLSDRGPIAVGLSRGGERCIHRWGLGRQPVYSRVVLMERGSFRSPLARAIGLGSAKKGVQHWLAERLSVVALVPLSLWFVASIIAHAAYRSRLVS
jgi:succinate dehydrogenase/fumarate reductase transmembrane subunit